MYRIWGDDHVLNTFYLGTSSSRSDDVEWFTGLYSVEPVFNQRIWEISISKHHLPRVMHMNDV